MNAKQLLVAAGLILLATACKEEETIKPSNVPSAVSSPAARPDEIDSDPVYTTDGKSGPLKIKTTEESTTPQTQEISTPKQDVMPVQVEV